MNLVIDCNVNCYNETNSREVSTDLSLIWLYYSYLHQADITFGLKGLKIKQKQLIKTKFTEKLLTNKRQDNDSKNNMGICG